jgi:hypothetical protein
MPLAAPATEANESFDSLEQALQHAVALVRAEQLDR